MNQSPNKKLWRNKSSVFHSCKIESMQNDSLNSSIVASVFVTAVTFLPNNYLGKKWGYCRRHICLREGFMKSAVVMDSDYMISLPYLIWLVQASGTKQGDSQTNRGNGDSMWSSPSLQMKKVGQRITSGLFHVYNFSRWVHAWSSSG
jgi:hypothetical protein